MSMGLTANIFAAATNRQNIHNKIGGMHRDKTRVQMPAKKFPHLKLLCWLFMGWL